MPLHSETDDKPPRPSQSARRDAATSMSKTAIETNVHDLMHRFDRTLDLRTSLSAEDRLKDQRQLDESINAYIGSLGTASQSAARSNFSRSIVDLQRKYRMRILWDQDYTKCGLDVPEVDH
uniref:Uncharacterized protein n=1 Tax=Kwoniella bestiolae CBS 10118 TaxID=1296100 RepID=A0A1B9G170_9TREE|nr:hypothetical protein I302_06226 [Kwoniella bestiolae CBS 10118]OCF24765.1 hypothetical protein I302_06226 [Kwoniella bestiolae CBS 10118]